MEGRKKHLKSVGGNSTLMDSIMIERGKSIMVMVEKTTSIRYNTRECREPLYLKKNSRIAVLSAGDPGKCFSGKTQIRV